MLNGVNENFGLEKCPFLDTLYWKKEFEWIHGR